jgi:Ca2+-transporting ATPase
LSFKSNFAAEKIVDSLLVAVSLAVAAIPEGLPAVVTITLAFGMQAMAKQNAIVRKATAVETLGCTTVICSDKTGTITRNEMNVKKIGLFDNDFEFTGDGFETKGIIVSQGKALAAKEVENFSGLQLLLKDAVLCNNSDLESLVGDSTELALLVAAKKASLEKKDFGKEKLVAELPFDSDRKRMSVVFGNSKEKFLYCKGSVESVLAVSNYFFVNGKEKKLGEKEKQEFLRKNNDLASAGLRVLGFAFKRLEKKEKDFSVKETEKDLVFLGLVGMIDSARSESKAAIELAKLAGIKVKMITGDHKLTAIAVGKEIGLIEKESEAITGLELDELNDKELAERIERLNIFARVSPEHKLRIISALQSKHEVVAMTGDGVNDALALKKADIGIAMGITGTDVAKEASSMVLADDNFATIVSAVREGRKVFANIKNFIRYLLATNIGEVIIVSFAAFFWNLLPLLPIHILFLNLVTDGLPALALGKEKLDEDLMKRPPRKKNENMINEKFPMLFVSGLVATVVVLVAFLLQNPFVSANLLKAQTIAFATLVIFELVFVFDCRSETKNLFQVGLFSNKALLLAVFVSLLLTVAVIQVSLISQFFKTVPLSFGDWLLVALLSLFSLVVRPLTNVLLSAKKSLFKN